MEKNAEHQFVSRPHYTFIALSIPVLFSLIAEPLTGLIDTAFVASLGAEPLAALGVGTSALSVFFWIFNFLGVGTQTEVAQAVGNNDKQQGRNLNSVALMIALALGVLVIIVIYPLTAVLAQAMGATGTLQDTAVEYMQIRILGAPAVLLTMTAFGALRGLQDMRTPMWVATAINALNILLDYLFIFGWGIFPEMGVAGAALASVIAQWIGAIWAVTAVNRQLGFTTNIQWADGRRLFTIGGDLFVRSGSLLLFMIVGTRVATLAGAADGAAHQAVRQVWSFFVFVLDAYAITAQSLVGYFLGAKDLVQSKRVATLGVGWSLATGAVLTVIMLLGQDLVTDWFVPEEAIAPFITVWVLVSLSQPLNSLAFITDGIHWGTGDYAYLRNSMMIATATGLIGLFLINPESPNALFNIWITTVVWITIRAVIGVIRIWPGVGAKSPWKESNLSQNV